MLRNAHHWFYYVTILDTMGHLLNVHQVFLVFLMIIFGPKFDQWGLF